MVISAAAGVLIILFGFSFSDYAWYCGINPCSGPAMKLTSVSCLLKLSKENY